jgi:hypothetical protein
MRVYWRAVISRPRVEYGVNQFAFIIGLLYLMGYHNEEFDGHTQTVIVAKQTG